MVAVLSPVILPEIRLTVDEYLAADLPEGYRYELVEGVVIVAPVPGVPHDSVLDKLHRLFVRYGDARPDLIGRITQRCAVTLPPRQTVREPDFAVYEPLDFTNVRSWKDVVPTLIVEVVSIGQESRDYSDKRSDYWDAGVAEYWIIDPQQRTMLVLTRGPSDWVESLLDSDQEYSPPRFPGLRINIASLFVA